MLHPTPLTTGVVALFLFAAAVVMLGRIGWLPEWPRWIFGVGNWLLAAVFLLRAIGEFRYVGFFKSVRDTRFARWDTALFSPLCLLIAGLAATVALLAP